MMRNKKGDTMKLSQLVNEVNQEQDLYQLVDKLCNDIAVEHIKQYPALKDYRWNYEIGRKYIKVIENNQWQRSVWGFINLTEFTNKKGVKFRVGDVLKAAGWQTPTLNAPRGNLFDGYEIVGMRKYGPDYLI